jgi:hypothetical protein
VLRTIPSASAGPSVAKNIHTMADRQVHVLEKSWNQGLTLVHFSAQRKRFLWAMG